MIRRLVRFLLFAVLALVLLGLLAAKLVSLYLPSFKSALRVEISNALGMEVYARETRFEFRPLPKIIIDDVELNVPGQQSKSISIHQIVIGFSILPLLNRQIHVRELIFEKPLISIDWLDGKLALGRTEKIAQPSPPIGVTQPMPDTSRAENIPWQVTFDSMRLNDGLVQIKGQKHEWQVKVYKIQSSLKRDGAKFILSNSIIKGLSDRLGFELAASQIDFNQDSGDFEVKDGRLILGNERLQLNGSWTGSAIQIEASIDKLNLGQLLAALPHGIWQPGFPILDGDITSKVKVSTGSNSDYLIQGELRASRIKSALKGYSVQGIDIKKLSLLSGLNGIQNASADLSLQKLRVADGADNYESDELLGSLSYSVVANKNRSITGSVGVKAFQYYNERTKVSDVVAELSKIVTKVDRFGGVSIKANLTGSSVKVIDPSVTVESAKQVSVPIEIIIPAKGGYEVKGPVAVSGGVVNIAGHAINDVGGTVEMLVSGPLKQFRSQELVARIAQKSIRSKVDFSMTPHKYELKPATFAFEKGTIGANFVIERGRSRSLTAQVSATDVELKDLAAISRIESPDNTRGTLNRLQVNLKSQMGTLLPSLSGQGSFEMVRGGARAERFLQRLLKAVAAIPLAGSNMNSNDSKALGTNQRARGDFIIQDQSVRSENIVLEEPNFVVKSKGSVNFSGEIKAKAAVVFLRDAFSAFGLGFDRLGNLLGRAGKIEIPVKMSGHLTDPKIEVDLVQLAKNNSGLPLLRSGLKATRDFGSMIFGGGAGSSSSSDGSSSQAGL